MSNKKNQPEINHPQAPPFDDRHMVVVRSEEHKLYVHLSQEDALSYGQDAARKRQQADQMLSDLKKYSKGIKKEIDSMITQASKKERACDLEAKKEPVMCDVIYNYRTGEAITVRKDTGQVQVKLTRTLQKHELEEFAQTKIDTDSHLRSVPVQNSDIAPFVPIVPEDYPALTETFPHEDQLADPDELDTFPEATEVRNDCRSIGAVILDVCRSNPKGATLKTIVGECLQIGNFGDNADNIAALVAAQIADMKDAGMVTGRFGRGKRWKVTP